MKLSSLTFGLIASLISLAAAAQSPAGAGLPEPWPPGPDSDTHWGVRVPDPYRAHESVKDERVQRWLREQGAAGAKVLAQLPGRAALLERVKALDAEGRASRPRSRAATTAACSSCAAIPRNSRPAC